MEQYINEEEKMEKSKNREGQTPIMNKQADLFACF